jgi:hypothetical protein
MNAKSLIPLVILAGAGALLAVFGAKVAAPLGFRPTTNVAAAPAEPTTLAVRIDEAAVRKIELTVDGKTTVLERKADEWTQPGNWPVVQSEAKKLVRTLTTLQSRFVPLAYDAAKAAEYGFDGPSKPIEVKVNTGNDTIALTFGQPAGKPGEPLFDRPTFVRVEGISNVFRLSPEVYVRLNQPGDTFRRRQLVPDAERVKIAGGEPAPNPANPTPPAAGRQSLVTDAIQAIKITTKDGTVSFKRTEAMPKAKPDPDRPTGEPVVSAARLAQAWEIVEPVRDRVDPAKLRSILTALPELWAESFVTLPDAKTAGLDQPESTIAITKANGQTLTLRIGKESRRVSKLDGPPPSPFNPRAQPPTMINEVYAYAKLDDNPQLFEVRTDKLTDLVAKFDDLRDATVARFETADVLDATIARPGQPPVKLVRKKGAKDAEKDDEKQDRWYVGEGLAALLAETAKVTELLDALGKLEARNAPPLDPTAKPDKAGPAVIDAADAKKLGDLGFADATQTVVTVTAQGRVAEGDTPLPVRTFKIVLGKADADAKKVAVKLDGWPVVRKADDAIVKLIERPALAYRGRRLLDTADAKLTTLEVQRDGKPAFALKQTDAKWTLTAPTAGDADEGKAGELAGTWSRLEAVEYVNDVPKPDDLAKYGLDKPRLVVNLGFTGGTAKPAKIEIGAVREGKAEAFARLNGVGSVFAVPNAPIESLEKGAVALIPLQLWQATSDKVTAIEIRRSPEHANETYKLVPEGANWKLSGPFDAPAGLVGVQGLLAAVANVKADRCEALAADPAKHGFDTPALKLGVSIKETKDGKETVQSKSLVIGKPAEGGAGRYAMLDGVGGGAVYVVPDVLLKDTDKPALDLIDRQLLTLDPMRITRIAFTAAKPEDGVSLVKDDKGTWTAEGAPFGVDKPTVDATLAALRSPQVARITGYGVGSKWADAGLEAPAATITVTLAPAEPNGKPELHTIKLGKIDTTGERNARIDDGPALAVLDLRTSDALARTKLDFADRTLLAFDPANLTGIARTKDKAELELSQNASLVWELTKPEKHKADAPTLDELGESLARLRAVKVAAFDAKDLKAYGLDAPAAVLTIKVGIEKPETKTLSIGGPVDPAKPQGDRYATVGGSKAVGVLPGVLAAKLLAEPIAFRDRNLAKFVDADRIQIQRGVRTVTFAKAEGTWKTTKPIAGDAEQADLDELVNALAKFRAEELLADNPKDIKPYGLDAPESTWKLFAGEKEVLAFAVGRVAGSPKVNVKLTTGTLVARTDETLSKRLAGEFRKRTAWTGVDAAQIETVAVSSGANSFSLRKVGPLWADPANPNQAIDSAKVTELLDALAGLKVERFAADEKADLKLYGLEPPERVVVVSSRSGTKTLHLGRMEGGSQRAYARVVEEGRSDVFVLSEADTAKLLKDRTAYRK